MEVQIISREIIKPPSLKKKHHGDPKTFQISLLDMVSPAAYIPIIFFYSMKEETTNGHFNKKEYEVARLKHSLSQTLVHFPMLGGKIKDNLIHCSNDEDENVGALFVEAKVKMTMAEFLKKPNLDLLEQFCPLPLLPNEPLLLETTTQVAAQVHFFSCGGIAIGFSFFHKLIDGTTMSAFIKCWAASNFQGTSKELVCGSHHYSISSLFPARDIPSEYTLMSLQTPYIVPEGKSSTSRRFVFDAMAISNLKAKAKSTSVPNPTSTEVVTCFIWMYAMKASRQRHRSLDKKELVAPSQESSFLDSKWGSVLIHLVNMRSRMQPPLSEREVGNIYWRSPTYYEASNTMTKLADLESILRESLSKINHDFLQRAIGEDGFETFLNSLEQLHELYAKSSETFLFSSWRNMGFNEVNFGWGKPIWNSCGAKVYEFFVRNLIFLMDTSVGKGIEAWMVLDDETMKLLENDYEFLEFASPNPSITLD